MRAVVIHDGDLLVEERPTPTPGPTEVLVAVKSAGLNGADILQRRGFYPAPAGAPVDIPGLEFAGEIVEIGSDVTSLNVGARVMGIVAGGAQATHCVIDASHALVVPDSVDLVAAGGFAEAFSTAHDALVTQARLRPGDRVLISGAAGGVGTAAVQIAAALGATVIASVRDEKRHDEVHRLGATHVISPDDVGHHGPYDVVLELVGAPSLEVALANLALNARISVIGVGAGAKVEVNLLSLMGARAQLTGATLRARSREDKASVATGVRDDLLPLLASGTLHVPILATYPIDEVGSAYERFTAGSKLGKIVLTTP
jgi:NADPH:quinone reductase-like Zn-dependent oxidoreductase